MGGPFLILREVLGERIVRSLEMDEAKKARLLNGELSAEGLVRDDPCCSELCPSEELLALLGMIGEGGDTIGKERVEDVPERVEESLLRSPPKEEAGGMVR